MRMNHLPDDIDRFWSMLMKIFTCKDRLEDIMTCIYDAWSEALLIGHDRYN